MANPKHVRPGAFISAVLATLLLAAGGCASQKEPAEQALAGIDKTLSESGGQVEKYLPERFAEINGKVTALRDQLAKQEYGDVVSAAPAVADELRRAIADSAIKRAQIRIEMENEWADLAKSVPAMIAAVDKKLATQGSRLPQGMDRASYRALVDSYDAARDAWSKAAAGMTNATFEATVMAGRDAKTRIQSVMQSLGIAAS